MQNKKKTQKNQTNLNKWLIITGGVLMGIIAAFSQSKVYVCDKDVVCDGENPIRTIQGHKLVTGTVRRYYPNGLQQEGEVVDGKANGRMRRYYQSGRLMTEAQFVNAQGVGCLYEYYEENGAIRASVCFKNGKADMSSIKEYDMYGNRVYSVPRLPF